ncbi:hypothetical protein E2C01_041749 [Portunus trituberculatus]|uniref:Uncharacterized protein n=1 Tax=Portunus trituberculatus TaxID=210409 RepID=A0A5B7FRJ2_PORTR|nr:hypothetical protein [Portunus trituberculatus]
MESSGGNMSELDPEPSIDPSTPRRVRAFAGTTVFMPCIVNNLGQRSVRSRWRKGGEKKDGKVQLGMVSVAVLVVGLAVV